MEVQIMTRWINLRLAALLAVIAILLSAPLNEMVTTSSHKAPPSATGDPAADGVALYDSRCALCHGKDGAGLPNWRSKGQPDFTRPEWQRSNTDEQIADAIKNGRGKFMPAFKGKLSEEDTGAVVQRIRAFGKKK
jgi:mono/diheme cytochrome c family protein